MKPIRAKKKETKTKVKRKENKLRGEAIKN
jgi:hypothetical protein